MKTKELLNTLQKLKPGLSTKTIVEQMSHFIFTENDILTYNDQICIIHPFKSNLKCSIPAKEFYDVLSKIQSDELELTLEDEILHIKGGKVKAKLSTKVEKGIEELIELLDYDTDDWINLPKDFKNGLSLCIFSASDDISQPFSTCINVSNNKMTSTDDLRISLYDMESDMQENFLIPAKTAMELIKFDIEAYHHKTDDWIYFITSDDVVFCCRLVNDEYPEIESHFEFDGQEIELPEDILNAVDTASILAEGDSDIDKKIHIEISKNKLICKGSKNMNGELLGEIETEISMDFKDKIKFAVNPIFFRQVLDKSKKAKIGDDRILFHSDNFKHLIGLFVD